MPDSRRRSRVPGQFEAQLHHGQMSVPVLTENLSLNGVSCRVGDCAGLRPGTDCLLRIELARGIVLEMGAEVMRCEDETLALEFQDMDATSFAHLRNIVRFASEDADAIDAEVGPSDDG